jgi:hypothetical protein
MPICYLPEHRNKRTPCTNLSPGCPAPTPAPLPSAVTNGWPQRHLNPCYIPALLALLATGTVFRSVGVLTATLDFWADEAWWAVLVNERPLLTPGIRPIGYMWMCRQLNLLGNPEFFLRLPSYLASIGVLACVCVGATRLLKSRPVILFITFVVALHPKLIVFAKEFKPYSLETFLHIGLTLWALDSYRRGRTSAAFWVAAAVSLLFCYNIVFLYPALALALVPQSREWLKPDWIRQRFSDNNRLRLVLGLAFIAGIVCLALFASQGASQRRMFWGTKYGVFPMDSGVIEWLLWYASKTWDLVTLPGALHGAYPAISAYLQPAFFVAYVLGVVALIRQRRHIELGLLTGPLVCVAVANVLGYWPYGPFRTNLFLIPSGLLVMGVGLDWLVTDARTRFVTDTAMLATVLLFLPVNDDYLRWKWIRDDAPSPQITDVLDELLTRQSLVNGNMRNVIIADWHAWRAMDYYLEHHPKTVNTYSALRATTELIRGPLNGLKPLERLVQSEQRRATESGMPTRAWIVVTKLDELSGIHSTEIVRKFGVFKKAFAEHDAFYHPELIELRFE